MEMLKLFYQAKYGCKCLEGKQSNEDHSMHVLGGVVETTVNTEGSSMGPCHDERGCG